MGAGAVSIDLANRLGEISPALRRSLSEHVEDNFGEILLHVFLGDVSRRAIYLAEQTSGDLATTELSMIIAELEQAFVRGNAEIREAIAVSFLEYIDRTEVANVLGPELERELASMEQQRDTQNRTPH